jgi:hypothetical protein
MELARRLLFQKFVLRSARIWRSDVVSWHLGDDRPRTMNDKEASDSKMKQIRAKSS